MLAQSLATNAANAANAFTNAYNAGNALGKSASAGLGSISSLGGTSGGYSPPPVMTANVPVEQLNKYIRTEDEYVKVLELFREFIDKWGETEFHGEEDQELYKWLKEEFVKIAELNQKV